MVNVKPKKHLGQHFLKDENIALKIVNALKNSQDLAVYEI
ncbi:MAG: 16S rRNA (adenine(1518)-N(6)/adenine(1519)-N(6))-dimethyltransferase, partial [Bacteroidota bacterium]